VHVLEEPLFAEIRTSRNQLKITAEEQAVLQKKKVGIVGLSVGSAIAMTMAMERSAGELVLADFDTIDLSNLNRVRGKISQIGVNKAVLMAREIAEMDPYLKITVFDEGVTEANLDAFFDQERPLDLLIDECDSLPVKIQLRLAAKQRGIPVLMETSDRGMLDVERFDLEADRPLFHGRLSDFDLLNLSDIDPVTRMGMLMALVDFDNISPRLKQSYAELGKTLNTWPQLASAVTLGGGSCADVARRVLMQEDVQSGRYYVDMQQILSKPAN
jgi:molybdopterin/thiamine biosynthesis adenylyltransferase